MKGIYHIYNRSICETAIFNDKNEYLRMLNTLIYYNNEQPKIRFSEVATHATVEPCKPNFKLVDVIAYCLMPTHIHLVVEELKEKGISIFLGNVLNSYTRYFNIKYGRKGPLWEGRIKKVLVQNTEQFLHVTRYIHLNPVTAYLVDKPEAWDASSYREYISEIPKEKRICNLIYTKELSPSFYKKFVEDHIPYQRELAIAKTSPTR